MDGNGPDGHRRAVLVELRARAIRVNIHRAVTRTPTIDADIFKPTLTPSPVPTSPVIPGLPAYLCLPPDAEPVRLPPDGVPLPLAETIRWLPHVEGARWTYERTSSLNEDQWARGQRQIQVKNRWRLADDAMLARLSGVISTTVGGGAGLLDEHRSWDQWEIILPGASYPVELCQGGEPRSLSQRRDLLAALPSATEPSGSRPWEVLLAPLAGGTDSVIATWRADEVQTLPSAWQLPAGLIASCHGYVSPTAQMYEFRRYLCPGVGWVADLSAGCHGRLCNGETDMLVSYHIPRWRVVP